MRTIQTISGGTVDLDGDVLAVLEVVSRELYRAKGLAYGFEDVDGAFEQLVAQLSESELRIDLKESLFMSFNRYENERLANLMQKAEKAERDGDGAA